MGFHTLVRRERVGSFPITELVDQAVSLCIRSHGLCIISSCAHAKGMRIASPRRRFDLKNSINLFRGYLTIVSVISFLLGSGVTGTAAKAASGGEIRRTEASSWRAEAKRTIEEREYQASRNASGLQAPNRAHHLRTYFEAAGIAVQDRTNQDQPKLLALSLARLGRGHELEKVSPGVVTSEGARVEIARPALIEWYVNSSAGLEQGFTLKERPAGDGELVLELTVSHAQASLREDRVLLTAASGRRLNYGKLVVLDAAGKRVPARFEVPEASTIRLVTTDASAKYPLTIDPLLTQTADTLIESNGGSARLGYSVSSAGDVNGDGYADIIVGAPRFDAGEPAEGASFIFHGSASGIVANGSPLNAATQLESNQADARMGRSVSGAGDVNGDGYADVIVGARWYDIGPTFREGAAFVFHGSPSGIPDGNPATADAYIQSNQSAAHLGQAVSGAGDVNGDGYDDVIVGAHLYSDGQSQSEEGAAWVFHGSPNGITGSDPTTADTQLEANQDNAELGWSVSTAGDVNGDGFADVIVGAPIYEWFALNRGGVFIFHGSAAGVADGSPATAATRLNVPPNTIGQLGNSVADAGDVDRDGFADVIVSGGGSSALIYHGSALGIPHGTPSTARTVLVSDQEFSGFSESAAGAGDVNGDGFADVIVGAPRYDGPEVAGGAAFIFLGDTAGIPDGDPTDAFSQLYSIQASAWLGFSVSHAGDVNGDGYGDVIAGATLYDDPEPAEGAAFVYEGGNPQAIPLGIQPALRQRGFGASSAPVQPGGAVFSSDRFVVDFFAVPQFGGMRVKLEIEICPVGGPFGVAACRSHVSPDWTTLGASGSALEHIVTGLAEDTSWSWRARGRYTATPSGEPASFVAGDWYRLQARATPGDIRTVPEPSIGLALSLGAMLMAMAMAMQRRRRSC